MMSHFRKCKLAIPVLVLLTWPHSVSAESLFRICVIEWPPYLYFQDGQARGSVAERINLVATRMNTKAVFVEMTRPRCAKEIDEGNIDALFPSGIDIKGLTQSSTSFFKVDLGYYVLASSELKSVPESLVGKTVLSALGVYLAPEVLRGANQMAVSNIKDAIALMAGGRADFAFGDIGTIQKYYPDAKALKPVLMQKEVGLGFSNGNDQLRTRFDRANK